MDVCLVAVPFQNIENPSISLSILKAGLNERKIQSEVFYANFSFAEKVGLKAYYSVVWSGSYREALIGEYVFSAVAFQGYTMNIGYERFLRCELESYMGKVAVDDLLKFIEINRQAVEAFIDETAQAILAKGAKIVGCASTTQQNCASLALLRRIKELDATVITMMGGANCEEKMGRSLVQLCPWLDFVIAGEADEFFAEFCENLLCGLSQPPFPYGVLAKSSIGVTEHVHRISQNLDHVPIPDYDDYFSALATASFKAQVQVGLLIETSRGCWWGEKHPCSFCGLSGAVRQYREKSPRRVIDEFIWLRNRYGIQQFFAVDCILSFHHLKQVLPKLASQADAFDIMYEVKSNLSFKQLKLMKQAGVHSIQPGIESLNDSLLKLMNKGNKAIHHVALLKDVSELQINCCWLILCDFPGEKPEWYEEQSSVIKKITHLQPPSAMFKVRYDRFNQYYYKAKDYGLNLVAAESYHYIYPLEWKDQLNDLAYFLVDENQPRPLYAGAFLKKHHQMIASQLNLWQASYQGMQRDRLVAKWLNHQAEIIDLRQCAKRSLYTLVACEFAVAHACCQVISQFALKEKLRVDFSAEEIDQAVNFLIEHDLILKIGDHVLFLPLNTGEKKQTAIKRAPVGTVYLS